MEDREGLQAGNLWKRSRIKMCFLVAPSGVRSHTIGGGGTRMGTMGIYSRLIQSFPAKPIFSVLLFSYIRGGIPTPEGGPFHLQRTANR
jgi:hypothetical protein